MDATASKGSSQRCRDQRSKSGTDFTTPKVDFAALIRGCWLLSWEITFHVLAARVGEALARSWHILT